jgi:hypothetical protein
VLLRKYLVTAQGTDRAPGARNVRDSGHRLSS